MKFARMVDGTAVETFEPPQGFTINDCFHAEVAALFEPVPDNVTPNSTRSAQGVWAIAAVPAPADPPAPALLLMTPTAFYVAFTPQERIAIKSSADPMVKEFWDTFNVALQNDTPIDPNLISTKSGLAYLATPGPNGPGILASQDRIEQILKGIAQ